MIDKDIMDRMDKKVLWGKKVISIENRFGKTLEDILRALNQRGLSYRQQGKLLGVSGAQIGHYCKAMRLTPLKKLAIDDMTLLSIAGLKEKE